MFEDSLFESKPHIPSRRNRYSTAASIALQSAVASLLIALPLLHPESLPRLDNRATISVPPATPPPPTPKTLIQRPASNAASIVPTPDRQLTAPRRTPNRIDISPAPSTSIASFQNMTAVIGIPSTLVGTGDPTGSHVAVTVIPAKKQGAARVSAGVSAGLLLTPIRPIYPQIARAAHIEGTVIVEAVISRTGSIESLNVVSGPAMLQSAALDAIKAARYQPFRLNGEPTEVQTTITVNFRLGT